MKNFETIAEYNDVLGVETQHPLVSVIDMNKAGMMYHMQHTMSFYSVYLKDEENCELTYGQTKYDFKKGSVVCLAPGQNIGTENTDDVKFQPRGWALFFHPDLIKSTMLERQMRDYSFFDYQVNEALHLSDKERKVFVALLEQIQNEVDDHIDRLSKRLIAGSIQLLLDHCLRFYERQFCTRESQNQQIMKKFQLLLDTFFERANTRSHGLPTVKYFASECCLSPNYFGDLIKKESGRTPIQLIKEKTLEEIKYRLQHTTDSITTISEALGFQYPQHMTTFFKKETTTAPMAFRKNSLST